MTLVMLLFLNTISQTMYIVYASLGILSSGLYIIIDLILILKPGMSDMDDYILGAMSLYLDIIRMFIYILMLLGNKD